MSDRRGDFSANAAAEEVQKKRKKRNKKKKKTKGAGLAEGIT